MAEIVNLDEVARIVARMEPEPGHGPLLDALSRRYPNSDLMLVGMSSFHRDIGALISRDGETVAEDYKVWITGEYQLAGRDAKVVHSKYRDAGLAISEEQGERIIISIPYGDQPDAFLQLEIMATRKVAERLLLDNWRDPEDLDDLIHSSRCFDSPRALTSWRYSVKALTNTRTFLRDLKDVEHAGRQAKILGREPGSMLVLNTEGQKATVNKEVDFLEFYPGRIGELPELRFFEDWRESSAGLSGARLCAHWWLDFADTRPYGGRLTFVPRWADSDCSFPFVSLGERFDRPCSGSITSPPTFSLPQLGASDHRSIYTLMAALEEFDEIAGYQMAWYFYLLHGNRVSEAVGDAVAKAVQEGKIGLPEHDAQVLARWRAKSYGF